MTKEINEEEIPKEQKFLEGIVKELVTKQDEINIVRTVDDRGTLYTITADKDDVSKIIGRNGNIAQAIRLLLKAVGYKYGVRASMKIDVPHPQQTNKE